ncbi:two-component regulator propeller domain-containing protein [Psychroserpens sp. Hel_I_66]|uniref:type IX secretion system anionic LPS delivery protein PorZ n=1 Tax=Psychroserpens sp. Hel_I_66 TaxID=1250004 RepID=UPI0006454ED6|nr:two-component regulator propeller domain-containing protein [Psychroserpens sp. Hel_I_66]
MFKRIVFILLILLSFKSFSQEFSSLWEGYFSYFEIKDITQGDDKIFAASENAIFSYDVLTNEINKITTIEGLSGETISTIRYSESFDLLVVGYETGLMEIVFNSSEEILSVVDILEKESISPVLKKINHFNEHDGLLYISTDYGISVYDLNQLQFGDTYFIGDGGGQIAINQTAVFDNFIYAACGSNSGLRKASLDNDNLIDFQQWSTISFGNYVAVQTVGNNLCTIDQNKILYEVVSDILNSLITYPTLPVEVKSVDSKLIVALKENVFVYDENFVQIQTASTSVDYDTDFTCATINNDDIYIGTNSTGILKTISGDSQFDLILPDGPSSNSAFKIQTGVDALWVTYGDYTVSFNPNPQRSRGISVLRDSEWNNIPYDSLLNAKNLVDVVINPFNPSQVFISSFQNGILEMNNEEATILYDQDNSGLESLVVPTNPNIISIRQSASKFDRNGLMWTLTSKVDRALKSYDPSTGQWQGYSFSELIPTALSGEQGFGDLEIGGGMKWISSFSNGVIGYNTETQQIKNVSSEEQNMPSSHVRAIALDSRNQLWIGTIRGLRVLFNTSGFVDDPDPSVNEIVILEDGIPTELLSNQFITDIKVDGSDNKWVGTLDSGIFYFSPDGQETIYQFTTANSPLPSNSIADISIDPESGKVYIATNRGLVSFSSGGTKPQETLDEAYIYPNPVRPEYDILGFDDLNNINNGIKVSGLTENVNIKITDIEGNLVAEAQSRVNQRSSRQNYNFAIDGGTGIWNGKNLRGNIVATGVYLFLISDLDSFETKVLKVLVVR